MKGLAKSAVLSVVLLLVALPLLRSTQRFDDGSVYAACPPAWATVDEPSISPIRGESGTASMCRFRGAVTFNLRGDAGVTTAQGRTWWFPSGIAVVEHSGSGFTLATWALGFAFLAVMLALTVGMTRSAMARYFVARTPAR